MTGVVQGVGFRPTTCRLARALGLSGFVRNDAGGVRIEIEGPPPQVARFLDELPRRLPSLARIDSAETTDLAPEGDGAFVIAGSDASAAPGGVQVAIPADVAPCGDCLRELDDPGDRRFRYPFVNCTACGPRFTIVRDVPYDRPATTMAGFPLCGDCRREYEDPEDRRFHAEPVACPRCGPSLRFLGAGAVELSGEAALAAAIEALRRGDIVAVKGVGGYALAVDGRNASAVQRLRDRKRRPHRAFALMVRDLATAAALADLDAAAAHALASPARPIVIVPRRPRAAVAPNVAPGLASLGLFLPPSPLQHLLAADGPAVQVMTSGNLSAEPIAAEDTNAIERLARVADAFLYHDRPIHCRADDSVVRVIAGAPSVLRRARGFVPDALPLPSTVDVLGVGGDTKNTVCVSHGGRALLSQHVGDVGSLEGLGFFREACEHTARLAGASPVVIAHDLHPDYHSTRWALARGAPCIAVQHHHAHVAACMVEHGLTEPVLAIAFDGTGLGPDRSAWGGEILEAGLTGFRRLGHLWPLPLAGGEAAIREPWRLAAAALSEAGLPATLLPGVDARRRDRLGQLLARPDLPRATGAGRWFDAVAALCGLRQQVSYDGQAAIELEAVAAGSGHAPYDHALTRDGVIDLRPCVRGLVADLGRGVGVPVCAARFHETLAAATRAACRRARDGGAPRRVVLTGGCFQNRRLTERLASMLVADGFDLFLHRRVPANDGGLALGQVAVAAALLAGDTPSPPSRAEGWLTCASGYRAKSSN